MVIAETTREIRLADAAGREHAATVELHARRWSEGGYSKRECRIVLRWERGEVSASDWNFFAALCRIRVHLTPLGLRPLCYGASRNVIISGMAADMGEGLSAYRVELGRPATRDDLVSIFDSGPDIDAVSVEEQRAFRDRYYSSLRSSSAGSGAGPT